MFEIASPIQTVLITARGTAEVFGKELEKDNAMAADWHCPLNMDPELYGISIGKQRFSHSLIKKSKVFAINFMPYELKEKVLLCGRISGKAVDKFEKASLTKEEADTIDCPIVGECVAFIECKVIQELDFEDHTFFIGKVMKKRIKSGSKRLFHLEQDRFTTTA